MTRPVRSFVHMLTVAAARVEQTHGNPKLVSDLKDVAKHAADRKAEGAYEPEDEKRIGRQRTAMAMVPDTRAKDHLMSLMAQRAYDLMWDGNCHGCDAIAEFLPSALVEKMFQAWENDNHVDAVRSAFYAGDFSI